MKYSYLFFVLFVSCGVPQSDYDKLLSENESLKAQVDELVNGPDRIYERGIGLMYSDGFDKAKVEFASLVSKYPGSVQAIKADSMIGVINLEVEKLENKRLEVLANATKKMRSDVDEVAGVTWYRDKNTVKSDHKNSVHLYIGTKADSKPWLRFRIQYGADKWLFIKNYTIKADNQTFDFVPDEVKRDNSGGLIWEWCDQAANDQILSIVDAMINAKSVTIRHIGNQYYSDRRLSGSEKSGLKNVLDAFLALGG